MVTGTVPADGAMQSHTPLTGATTDEAVDISIKMQRITADGSDCIDLAIRQSRYLHTGTEIFFCGTILPDNP